MQASLWLYQITLNCDPREGRQGLSLSLTQTTLSSVLAHAGSITDTSCLLLSQGIIFRHVKDSRYFSLFPGTRKTMKVDMCEAHVAPTSQAFPLLFPDVSAAASCVLELQQCPATNKPAAAAAKACRSRSAPARGGHAAARADHVGPSHKPAPAPRIECDIHPGTVPSCTSCLHP